MRLTLTLLLLCGQSALAGNAPAMFNNSDSRLNLQGFQVGYSATSVVQSGGSVSKLADFSNKNWFGTQTTAARQPTLITNFINGWPVLTADGTNTCMVFTNSQIGTFMANSGLNATAYFVMRTSNTFGNTVFAPKIGTAGTTYEALIAFSDGNCYVDFGNNLTARMSGAGNATNLPITVWALSRNGANGYLYKNGVSVITSSGLSGALILTTNEMAIFADLQTGTPATQMRGVLAEISFMNESHSPTTLTNNSKRIAARYNITIP